MKTVINSVFATSVTALMLASCVEKVLVLQTPVVSMKQNNAGATHNLTEGAAIEEKWCNSEDPIRKNDDGSKHYGMIDQVIWRAHDKTQADFFLNNRFYQQGDCMWMNATVAQLSSGGGHAAPEAVPAPQAAPRKAMPHKSGPKGKKK